MPSLLVLMQDIPYPPTRGGRVRTLHILEYLALSYKLHLGCLIDNPQDMEHVPTVRAMCTDAYFATLNRKRAKITCLRGLLTGEPLSVTFYRHHGLAAWVRRVVAEVKPEVIFVFSSNMAPYILDLCGRERVSVIDLTDIDSEKWRAYAHTKSGLMSWMYAREGRRIARLEAYTARKCDWSTLVSPDEALTFATMLPDCANKIRSVSNGVDCKYFDPTVSFQPPYDTTKPTYVFTGAMDSPPNIDAVTWFAEEILLNIRCTLPMAQFYVVGFNPSPEVLALAKSPGVFVIGGVPDIRPFVAYATAVVVPIRTERGLQNKVLEAMAMARPVVVTPDALKGIYAVSGREVLLAKQPDVFAKACVHAAEPGSVSIGHAARRRVLADYVWAERLRGFDILLKV